MAANMPDLRTFFNTLLKAQPLGRSPGLGTGPNTNPNSPVGPTAGGEGIRALWGMLQPPEDATAKQGNQTSRLNLNAPGSLVKHLFNQSAFPQLMPDRKSPFPQPVTSPVPSRQFATDPEPTIPGAPNKPDEPRDRPGVEEPSATTRPPSPDELRGGMTPEQLAAWEAWVRAQGSPGGDAPFGNDQFRGR